MSALERRGLWATLMASLLVLVAGGGGLAVATRGFTAWTTEDARRLDIAERPQRLPPIRLSDHTGASWLVGPPAGAAGADTGIVTIATFMYSRCQTLCSVVSAQMRRLQHEIGSRGLSRRVRLLSVSFDPQHDVPVQLSEHAQRLGVDSDVWRMASIANSDQLPQLLRAFGVQVLPTPEGEFEHNAAFHLIDGRGRLVEVMDIDEPHHALAAAWRWSESAEQAARVQAQLKAGGV